MLDLSKVGYFVLDEADTMLDMGFMPQTKEIIEKVNAKRQTLMFSATWPTEVQNLAKVLFQNVPTTVKIGDANLSINDQIKQSIYRVKKQEKIDKLTDILDKNENSKTVVFCNKKWVCSR